MNIRNGEIESLLGLWVLVELILSVYPQQLYELGQVRLSGPFLSVNEEVGLDGFPGVEKTQNEPSGAEACHPLCPADGALMAVWALGL